jgi:hypothetical protein
MLVPPEGIDGKFPDGILRTHYFFSLYKTIHQDTKAFSGIFRSSIDGRLVDSAKID